MKHNKNDLPQARLDEVLELVATRLPASQTKYIEPFAREYLAQADAEDLFGISADDLYGAVLSHWHFLRKRTPGAPRVRVFNPRLDEHGWDSPHTVVEIVNDDMPFLVDSVTMAVNRAGLTLHLIIHPVLCVERDDSGILQRCSGRECGDGSLYESIMHLEVDRRTEKEELEALRENIESVLGDVRTAVSDWQPMCDRMRDILRGIDASPPPVNGDVEEVKAFLQWLLEGNFVLLGCRDYELTDNHGENELRIIPGSGLGLLHESGNEGRSRSFSALPPELKAQAHVPNLLTVTKSNSRSTVHRSGYLDFIGIKTFDDNGQVTGERRIIGLLASTAYNASPRHIPLLRHKVAAVIDRAGLLPGSHAGKTLQTILDRYPRDDLFQISTDELFEQAMGILRLGERQRTRLFVRRDPFARFVSCLIYVPRENFNTDQRRRMQAVLMDAFNGTDSDFDVHFSDSPLARIQIIVRARDGVIPEVDVAEVEQRIVDVSRRWEDHLQVALIEHAGEERGVRLFSRYARAFPAGYRENYSAKVAVFDIEQMEALKSSDELGMSLYRPLEASDDRLKFKLYRLDEPVSLSQSLRMLERMGVTVTDEQPAEIDRQDGRRIWMHDFGLAAEDANELDIDRVRPLFQETFLNTWRGDSENDDFNRLSLIAGLHWREVALLRAYAKYLKQAAFTFSQTYMEQALAAHAEITRKLVTLFEQRFLPESPSGEREQLCNDTAAEIEAALTEVSNLDEDRILRQFLALIRATLRTNFYQRAAGGKHKSYISFKFDPREIPNLPEPRPIFEIFVYSPRIEGVHLRGGKVARGGLRWSDRMEDFRTEILGLVKAQIVKNSVIVPVGSKGGFVVKHPPVEGGREAQVAEGLACYRTFLRGLLDVTDNLVHGEVQPPQDVVRHDEDDPYLVVAADKGTATFSDYANEISAEYGFWLGDAFASGGSIGYDHKKMGITARGAWESIKRHFRELGIDIQSEPVRVAGIGDMSGDVFGNGMLLSKKLKLVAAFDHRHIFIDPDPDPETTWQERERLFNLPRSSWDDYDKSLISSGGGVWPRSAKSIALSDEMRALLDLTDKSLAPTDLIRAILRAPVDLLYNGGIGTYIKGADETHAAVGDRANDAVRVNGEELRCRVVGEGGNLGVTQLGRIEFALNDGLVNTDAIDNSGGVDCSDHEVNIKILLDAVIEEGELTGKQRNKLLLDMTDEVAALVLRDNYAQGQVLSVMRSRASALLDEQADYIRRLEHAGRLNRWLEFLPDDEEIAERRAAGKGLVTPELAVLLAYSKIELYDQVLASDVPEDPYISTALVRYFPEPLRERFADHIDKHPLKREIIATHVINSMINRVGSTFVSRVQAEVGATPAEIVRAYVATREIFETVACWRAIETLDDQVPASVQTQMLLDVGRLIESGTRWFLRHRRWLGDIRETIGHFQPGVARLSENLADLISPARRDALESGAQRYIEQQVPELLARHVLSLHELYPALDLVEISAETERPEALGAGVYFALGGELEAHWLERQIAALPADSRWQALARSAMRVDLSNLMRRLTLNALRLAPSADDSADALSAWAEHNHFHLERYACLLADVRNAATFEPPMLSVLMRELAAMAE